MFGVDSSEFLLIAIVALVVIGPKDLPKAMRVVGYWVGKARGISRSFRQGFDNMVREAELEEMEKRWAAENARIMAEHPASSEAESLAAAEPFAPADPGPLDAPVAATDNDAPVMVAKPVVAPAPIAATANDAPVTAETPTATPASVATVGNYTPAIAQNPAIDPAPGAAAHSDATTMVEKSSPASAPVAATTTDAPVMVEKPVVTPAPGHQPAPRPDSTPS